MLIATNPNGSTIVTVMNDGGNIHVSHNSGATWLMDAAMNSNWRSLSVSDDGQKILAADESYVYLSIDGGVNWDGGFEAPGLTGAKISGDGTRGAIFGSNAYLSDDGCATWNAVEGVGFMIDASSTLDTLLGINAPTGPEGVRVMTSNDFGATWVDNGPYDAGNGLPVTLMTDGFIRFLNYTAEILEYEYENISTEFKFDGEALITGFFALEAKTQSVLGDWMQIPGVSGFEGDPVIVSDDGQIVLIGGYGGIIRSDNGGTSFTKVYSEVNVYDIFSASDDFSVIVSRNNDGNLIASTDSGATWEVKEYINQPYMISSDGTKIYANDNSGGISVSEDLGNTWDAIVSGADGFNWWAASKDFSVVYTQFNSGPIMKSIDSGVTFDPIPSVPGVSWFLVSDDGATIISDSNIDGVIGVSSDFGETWTTKSTSEYNGWDWIFVSDDGNTVGFNTERGIFLSTDSGATWLERPFSSWGSSVTIRGNNLYTTYEEVFYKSNDLGLTFKASNVSSFNSFEILDDGTVIAGANANVLKSNKPYVWWDYKTSIGDDNDIRFISSSKDGSKIVSNNDGFGPISISIDSGDTWWSLPYDGGPRGSWGSIASSADGVKIIAVDENNNGKLYKSNDSGATWVPIADGPRSYQIACSSDGEKIVSMWNNFVNYSTDFGDTWTQIYTSVSNYFLSPVISGDGTKIAFADSSGYVFVSVDSGATWNSAFVTNFFSAILTMTNDGVHFALASTGEKVFVSDDSGATWTETGTPSEYWVDIKYSADGSNLIVIDDYSYPNGTLWTSSDYGVNWVQQTGLDAYQTSRLSVSADGQTVVVIGNYQSLIAVSTDGGVTWSNSPGVINGSPYSLALSGDTTNLIVGTGGNLIYTSDDLGLTFETDESENFNYWGSLTISGDGSVSYATEEMHFRKSVDDGQSWTRTSMPDFANGPHLIDTSYDGSRVYIAISYYGVLASDDYGVTFDYILEKPNSEWYSLSVSDDGANIVLIDDNGTMFRSDDFGATWSGATGSIEASWSSIASSSDGTKLVAHPNSGYIYTSTDSGVTWTERTSSGERGWSGVASSEDGTKIVAIVNGSYIYTSTDSGVTWTERTGAGTRDWSSIASSSDGTKLTATTYGHYIYTSTDSGVTWTEQTGSGSKNWEVVKSSSDGANLVALIYNDYIYTSTDSGVTWSEQPGSDYRGWFSAASSSNGEKLAAIVNGGYIYTSTDSGVTWTERTSAGYRDWYSITSSADGSKLAASVVNGGYIYTSTDSGVTWTERTSAGSRTWYSITSSSDGAKLAAAENNGRIWVSNDSGATWSNYVTPEVWTTADMSADGQTIVAFDATTDVLTISRDFGETWTPDTTERSKSPGFVRISPNGKMAFAGFGNLFFSEETTLHGIAFNAVSEAQAIAYLEGDIPFVFSSNTGLAGYGYVDGTTDVVFDLELLSVTEIAGTTGLIFVGSAPVTGLGSISAQTSISTIGSALINGRVDVMATSALTFNSTASMRGVGLASAISTVAFAPTALVSAIGNTVGTSTLSFATAGVQTGQGSLGGTNMPVFAVQGTLRGSAQSQGSTQVVFAPNALGTAINRITSTITLAFATTGQAQGTARSTANSSLTFTPNAALRISVPVVGSSSLTFALTGALAGIARSPANSTLTFSRVATLDGYVYAVGTAEILFEALGATGGFVPIAGAELIEFSTDGSIRANGRLIGSIPTSFATTGAMLGAIAISGSASTQFATTGTVVGRSSLTGTNTIAFAPTATAKGSIFGSGTSSLSFTTHGVQTGVGSLGSTSMPLFATTGTLVGQGSAQANTTQTFTTNAMLGITVPVASEAFFSFGTNSSLKGTWDMDSHIDLQLEPLSTIRGVAIAMASNEIQFDYLASVRGSANATANTSIVFDALVIPSSIVAIHGLTEISILTESMLFGNAGAFGQTYVDFAGESTGQGTANGEGQSDFAFLMESTIGAYAYFESVPSPLVFDPIGDALGLANLVGSSSLTFLAFVQFTSGTTELVFQSVGAITGLARTIGKSLLSFKGTIKPGVKLPVRPTVRSLDLEKFAQMSPMERIIYVNQLHGFGATEDPVDSLKLNPSKWIDPNELPTTSPIYVVQPEDLNLGDKPRPGSNYENVPTAQEEPIINIPITPDPVIPLGPPIYPTGLRHKPRPGSLLENEDETE